MLPRKYRIVKEDMENIIKFGKGPSFDFFYVKKSKNIGQNSRFAIIVSKKVEKTSVGRHLLKRRFWSVLDNLDKKSLNIPQDYIFFIRKYFNKKDFLIIKGQIKEVIR